MADERRLTLVTISNSLLVSLMAVCLAAVAGRLVGLFGDFQPADLSFLRKGLIAGLFLVALEVQWTRRLMAPRPVFSLDWWKAIVLEWLLLLIGLWAWIWLVEGPDFVLEDLRGLSAWDLTRAIRTEHMVGLSLLFLVWGFSRFLVADLIPLENDNIPQSLEGLRDTEQAQSAARTRLWHDVFFFGGLLVLISLAGAEAVRIFSNSSANIGPVGMEILVYFLCGLGLFAMSRLMILRVDWALDRTRFDAGIPRRWMIYSLGFILILILLAGALPTDYSLSLLTSLNLAVQGIGGILMTLWVLIFFPFLLLLRWIYSFLFGAPAPIQDQQSVRSLEDAFPPLPPEATWVMVLRGILFWAIAFLVLIYLFRRLLKFRRIILRTIRGWPVLRGILDWIRGLEKHLTVWRRTLANAVRDSLLALREDFTKRTEWAPQGFLNLRRLTPSQSIRFYFFALLRRGAERGVARRPAQTPREYVAGLTALEESVGVELWEMAVAFEEARYTMHSIEPDKALYVRKAWDTVRSTMRLSGRKAGSGGNREP